VYRLIKELVQQQRPDFHIHASALALLYEASDASLISLFQDAYLCAQHAQRRILQPKDVQLAQRARSTKPH
jgi:histone H3/H4